MGEIRMRVTPCLVLLAVLFVSPTLAKVNFEQIDEGLYFVSYQANRMVQGGFLFDTKDKNTKKLLERVHKVCVEEGYSYLHVITPKEIVHDEALKAYWDMYADGEMVSQEVVTWENSTGRANIVKRLVLFTEEPGEDSRPCEWNKK